MEKIEYRNDIDLQISSLRCEVFVKEQGFKIEDELEANEYDYLHCCLLVDDILVAYLRLSFNNLDCHVQRVLVKKEYRKLGYGRKIMDIALNKAKEHNCKTLSLHAQDQATGFYLKCGYLIDGPLFYECGAPHYPMIYKI